MRNTLVGLAILAVIAVGVTAFLRMQAGSPEATRKRMAGQFVAVLPDSLTDAHRQEILNLFDSLWYRHDRGLVAQADVDTIMTEMQEYIDRGYITGTELVHYMAEVGYKTYSGEQRYRLPSGMVDHPVLNPKSALVDLLPDTAGYADWYAERQRQLKAEEEKKSAADSTR